MKLLPTEEVSETRIYVYHTIFNVIFIFLSAKAELIFDILPSEQVLKRSHK